MVSCLAPGGDFLVLFCGLFIYHVEKDCKKAENAEDSLNSLLLERIADLAMPLESLQTEVEGLGKQKEPVEGQQQGSGLVTDTKFLTR